MTHPIDVLLEEAVTEHERPYWEYVLAPVPHARDERIATALAALLAGPPLLSLRQLFVKGRWRRARQGLYSESSGQPDYGDKRAEIGGSDPGAMPGGSTSSSSLGKYGAEIGSTDVEG